MKENDWFLLAKAAVVGFSTYMAISMVALLAAWLAVDNQAFLCLALLLFGMVIAWPFYWFFVARPLRAEYDELVALARAQHQLLHLQAEKLAEVKTKLTQDGEEWKNG